MVDLHWIRFCGYGFMSLIVCLIHVKVVYPSIHLNNLVGLSLNSKQKIHGEGIVWYGQFDNLEI